METNYRANVAKWLPYPAPALEKWFTKALELIRTMDKHVRDIAIITKGADDKIPCDKEVLKPLVESLDKLIIDYKEMPDINCPTHPIYKFKFKHLSTTLKRKLNVVAKFTRNLLHEIIDSTNDEYLRMILRLVNTYNTMLDLDLDVSDPSINLFTNDCPAMLEPLKKISVTRILQLLAKNRAEENCHELIDCLLANYEPTNEDEFKSPESADPELSENSSIEIYRALTKHMTPPVTSHSVSVIETTNFESIQALVNTQTEQVVRVVRIVKEISPQLLGADSLKIKNGNKRSNNTYHKILPLEDCMVQDRIFSCSENYLNYSSMEKIKQSSISKKK